MRHSQFEAEGKRRLASRAAVFIDYENLYGSLAERIAGRDNPDEIILELLEELRRYLFDEERTEAFLQRAYADYSDLHGNGPFIQRSLYKQGIEPFYVTSSLVPNASELAICIHVSETVCTRADIQTFVIVSGDRSYLPLLLHLKQQGRNVLFVGFDTHSVLGGTPFEVNNYSLDAIHLLSEPTRRLLNADVTERRRPDRTNVPRPIPPAKEKAPRTEVVPPPPQYQTVTDEAAYRTLEIIEEFFGQYEEVYLTPLLRKLSEFFDEESHDPKSIISELEVAGAVWLEKRRGFPYDYTVLLVDPDHPDVRHIQETFFENEKRLRGEPKTDADAKTVLADETDYAEELADADDHFDDSDWDE